MVGIAVCALLAAPPLLGQVDNVVDPDPDPVLTEQQPASPPPVDPAMLRAALGDSGSGSALGPATAMAILDAATGESLYADKSDRALIPASSIKILTAAAVLHHLGPAHRLSTTVVLGRSGAGNELTIVGGGDATLRTTRAVGYPASTSLADLAERTAGALRQRGATEVSLRWDASAFSGEPLAQGWSTPVVASGLISPVSALSLDDVAAGLSDPAQLAAGRFAEQLRSRGILVAGTPSEAIPPPDAAGEVIATASSPPVAALVARMLTESDNDLAESLARLAAVAAGESGDFEGWSRAAAALLRVLDVPAPGLVVRDGSGISRDNRIAPITLSAVLRAAMTTAGGALTWIPSGLAVGGFTGTLEERFGEPMGPEPVGLGRITAKTGTLTGVTSLTGIVRTEQERALVFSIVSNSATDTAAARDAVDEIATRISTCGCAAGARTVVP